MSVYFLCFVLFCVGLYCLLRKRNIIKMLVGLAIIEYSLNLFLIIIGYRSHGRAPIFSFDQEIKNMVDPGTQAMVLTSIVIGLSVIVVAVGLSVRIYGKYKTFDITKIRRLKG